MKQIYNLLALLLFCSLGYSQNYDLGIVHMGNYDFKVVVIPDFNSAGNTDVSDVGFTLMLPAGMDNVIGWNAALPGRVFNVTEFDAAFLTGLGLGDGTKDAFQFNMPPGQSLFPHTSGQMIDLVTYSIDNMPISGEMSFLPNNDPIAMGAGGTLDSFYNANIDMTTTQDYFNGYAPGMESFNFSTLSIEDLSEEINSLMVFPNPTQGILEIRGTIQLDKIDLYDLSGRLISNYEPVSGQIDLSNLPSGLYILKLQSGDSSVLKRIVKR